MKNMERMVLSENLDVLDEIDPDELLQIVREVEGSQAKPEVAIDYPKNYQI